MKPRLPLYLLGALLATVSASAATDPGRIVFVGDSITQGGTWAGAGTQPSYRYSFFKNMIDQGLNYNPMGIGTGSSTKANPQVGALSYRGTTFDNTHEAAASARTYTWSGIPANNAGYNNNPGTRPNEAPVWNLLGLTNPQTGSADTFYNAGSLKTYTGPTYAEKYGEEVKPDTICVMIGINDLIAVKNGTRVTREDGTTSAYTFQDVIANTKSIVEAYQQYNPNANFVVMGLLPTAPNNGTYNMSGDYNALLQEAVKSWSTETSKVGYADVSSGLSITNQNHYDSGGAHPNNQGELIIAGNLANALGVGQRTLGLTGKNAAEFANRLDATTLNQTKFTLNGTSGGAGSEWNVFSDAAANVDGLLLQADGSSTASLTAHAATGWDVDSSVGFTLQASVQLYAISGNSLYMQFGDGQIGDGLLRVAENGVYWGTNDTLLFEGSQTSMNDFRVAYMPAGNEQGVDAGYYVWLNNQLIGEALAAGTERTDALTIGSASGTLTYAGIADVSWENGAWAPSDSSTIAASMSTAALPSVSALTGDAVVFNNSGGDLNTAAVWGDGSAMPTATDTIRFDAAYDQSSVSLSAELAVLGVQFETSSAVKIASSAAANTMSIGSGGIAISELGSNVFIQHVKLTDAQTWDIGLGKFLIVGTNNDLSGSLTTSWSDNDHTVTIRGGGTAILATAQSSLQNIDWKITEGSTIKAIWNTVGTQLLGGLGNGTVTLDDGTLGFNFGAEGGGTAQHGNWSFGNTVVIGQGGGTIAQCATTGANRWINLSGSLQLAGEATNEATLTFRRDSALAVTDMYGFILSGDNSAFAGKIVIDESAYLRVGASSTSSNNVPAAGTLGTLHAGILDNNGVLTLTRTDAWTVASTITGGGTINIGSSTASMNTRNQLVTFTGDNAGFTGTININQGTLRLGHAAALGNASAIAIGANGTLDLNGNNLGGSSPLSFTSGAKVTNTSDTTATIALAGQGISTTIWTNATIETVADKTIQLKVTGNHAVFNGKLAGSGIIEKTQEGGTRHLIVKSSGNSFDGKLKVEQGYLILDPTTANAQTFAAGYRPDLEIASGANFTVGNSFKSEENALKLGNVTGSGNFSADYGAGPYFIDVQIDQEGGATFSGLFQRSSTTRDYSVIKRGSETWTLTGASTAQGYLKVAEGDLRMQGSWIGATFVEAGANMIVSGAVGATGASRTHTVQEGGSIKLTGSGAVRNNGAVVSLKSGSEEGTLGNVTVASTGIARTSETGLGRVTNANIAITRAGSFNIENVRLANSFVELSSAASVTLDNVVLGEGTTLDAGTAGGSLTFRNSTVELGSSNIASSEGTSPVALTVSMGNSSVEGSFTLTFTNDLLTTIGGWEGGPYGSVAITLTDVMAWSDDTKIQFAGGETLFLQPEVANVATQLPTEGTAGTVVIDVSFGRPIPEPTTAALGLLGLSGLLLRRRRKA